MLFAYTGKVAEFEKRIKLKRIIGERKRPTKQLLAVGSVSKVNRFDEIIG